ncbi:SGNH/GDSL hydrolase family protein [Pedococcus sp. KACC 23699]|uniref:SGNH/GDSL hydrolase family protein n=1 Tax=Pedococcus sp. KACC 23699 TaxID=3149228 RepID=A0AAU7JVH7_9MICO
MKDTPPPVGAAFDYSNLSERPPGRVLELLRHRFSGVDRVESRIAVYASQWHEHNLGALAGTAPLWVALGDSITQGVGASSFARGWVMRAHQALDADHVPHRVLNLSVSGARTADVVAHQIPAMIELGVSPALVTVLIGSNDMLRHDHRASLSDHYGQLLHALPHGALVAMPVRTLGPLLTVKRQVEQAAAQGRVVVVPVRLGLRNHSEDHFHPNDLGHQSLADDFLGVLRTRLAVDAQA